MKTKELLQTKISYYSNVKYSNSYKQITLYDWISNYSMKNKNIIMEIRNIYDKHKTLAKQMKSQNLPAVTITGVFNEYRRVNQVSKINPIIAIDIDRDDNPDITDWNELKYKVAKLSYVFLTSWSCSGRGIYCLVYFNNELNFEKVFNALYDDFKQMNINIDRQCKDITRLRFVSYDDNMLIRQDEIEMYNKEKETNIIVNVENKSTLLNVSNDFTYRAIYHLITECNYRSNKYEDWLQDGFRLSTFGDLGYILFMLLSMKSDNYDEQAAKNKFIECQKSTRYNTTSLTYYFKKLKDIYGDKWMEKIEHF